ncbi:hypothetical protein QR680_009412 [Steinernema hermaphroditum]|uniref:Tonsoku-like protein n=1 Tax=Steinernema hermaphroditum TaxID=289476 RepID=A0AA39IK60_9BILA|nr:hypothetical protein QR680_009412 [Steinernema hermaphroditum]
MGNRTKTSRTGEEDKLRKRLRNAEASRDPNISAICLDLAVLYTDRGDTEEALKYFDETILYGNANKRYNDVALSYRQKTSIAIDEEDFPMAVRCIEEYLKLADKLSSPKLHQLGLHELCRIFCEWSVQVAKPKRLAMLLKARMYGVQSVELLKSERKVIAQSLTKEEGTIERLRAGVCQLLAKISVTLGQHDKAKKEIANCSNPIGDEWKHDYEFRRICMDTELETEKDQERRLTIARKMSDVGKHCEKVAKVSVRMHYAQELILSSKYAEAIFNLYKLQSEKGIDYAKDEIHGLMEYAYTAMKREKTALQSTSNYTQFALYEKLGDKAHEVGLPNVELKFYLKMLAIAERMGLEEKRWSMQSVAESLFDLNRFEEARNYYERLAEVEKMLSISQSKIVATKLSIFLCVVRCGQFSVNEKLAAFEKVYKLQLSEQKRHELLVEIVELLHCCEECSDVTACLQKYSADLRRYSQLTNEDDSGEEADDSLSEPAAREVFRDEFDAWSKERLQNAVNDFAQDLLLEAENDQFITDLKNKRDDQVNDKGETFMHLAARNQCDKRITVSLLIKLGYNVNAKCYGGWTPLTEAINFGCTENVRILITNGADVNERSEQPLEDADSNDGISPLEDACQGGQVEIANLLLLRGAKVSQRAVSYLTSYRSKNRREFNDSEIKQLDEFIELLRKRLKPEERYVVSEENHFCSTLRRSQPKPSISTLFSTDRNRPTQSEGSRNLNIYQQQMEKLGRGRIHKRTVVDLVLDEDDLEERHLKRPGLRSPVREISPLGLPLQMEEFVTPESRSPSPVLHSRSNSHSRPSSRNSEIAEIFRSRKRAATKTFTPPEVKRSSNVSASPRSTYSEKSASPLSAYANQGPRIPNRDTPVTAFYQPASRGAPTRPHSLTPQQPTSQSRASVSKNYRIIINFEDDKRRLVREEYVLKKWKMTITMLRTTCCRLLEGQKYDSMQLKYRDFQLTDYDSLITAFQSCLAPSVVCVISGWRVPQLSKLYRKLYPRDRRERVYRKLLDSEIGELNFSGSYLLDKDGILNVFSFVKMYSSLAVQTVNFQGISLNAKILAEMAELFGSSMTYLNISSCSLSDIMLKSMCDNLSNVKGFPELAELILKANFFSARQVDAVVRKCPELSTLDLSMIPFHNDISSRCEALGRTISGCPYLKELKMRSCGNVEHILRGMAESPHEMTSLQRIDVSCTSVESVFSVVKRCPNLRYLNLSDCALLTITDSDLDYVASSRIEQLIISGCTVAVKSQKMETFPRRRERRSKLEIVSEDCEFPIPGGDDPELKELADAFAS